MSDHEQAIRDEERTAAGADPAAGAAQPADGDVTAPHGDPLSEAVPEASGDADGPSAPEAPAPAAGDDVAEDLESLRRLAAERDQYLAMAQRAQADFDNYRRRMTREAAQAQERGVGRLAKELLPALDHLELALKAAETAGGELFQGVRMVQDEMIAALNRAGIQPFAPSGEPFDPNEHEAMVQRPVEGAEPGTVVEVYQQGYRINGAVLRPARVVVAA